ncbi:hypothetical protein Tco_0837159 [Tanacetum coccineum]
MAEDENSEYESDTEEPPFEKITINTDYKIKTSLEEPPTDLELKPLPNNLEYVFLEEPSFLPIIISSQLSKKKANLRMPFGLCNAPATFQRCMLAIFHDMIEESVEMPILSLIGKNVTSWSKKELCLDTSPNWNLPFELMYDASDFAVGAILGQKDALRHLFKKQDAKPRLIRWILLLEEFDIEIKDRKETENVAADHLSRIENDESSNDSEVDDNFLGETLMETNTKDDPWFADFANYLVGDIIPKRMTYQ